jgi:hypothetical protein
VEAVDLGLIELAGVEAPPAAVGLQELRRVLALGPQAAVPGSAVRIGGRADLDVELAVRPEGEGLGVVLPPVGKARDHELLRGRRHQLAGRELVAIHSAGARVIEIAVAEGDPAPAALAERLLDVGAAVAIRVAQGDDAALVRLHVDIAVCGDGQEADGARGVPVLQGVRHHHRPKALGQRDAAVVGIRNQRSGGAGPGRRGRRGLALDRGSHGSRSEHGEHQDMYGAEARLK